MQGDFEKKVQAKMEQLNMAPSAPVWEKVALRIRPEKRRRRVFVWLFLAVVLLGGGWLIATQQTKAPDTAASQNVSAKPALIPPSDVSSRREKNQSITESRIVHSNIPPTKITHQISGIKKEVLFKNNNRQKQAERKPGPEESFSRQPVQEMKENNRPLSGITDRSSATEEKNEASKTPVLSGEENAVAKETSIDRSANVVADTAINRKTPEPESVPAKDSSVGRKKLATAGKWKKQVVLQGGWSHFALDPAPGNYASYSSGIPVSNNGNFQPATYDAGGSFAIGFGLEKALNTHFQFSVALQYAYYSVRSTLGGYRRIDTTVSYDNTRFAVQGYYGNSPSTDYTTRMHFVELPVNLSYQPLTGFPLQVMAGVSYGRLLESTALTCQNGYNIYYYNEGNNNNDYFNLLAALQYSVMNKSGINISLGPQVQYSTNSIQKEYPGKEPHLFSAGLKTAIRF